MRLISQDGMIDVPYEQVSVELRDCDIWCGYYPTLSQHLISKKFATYSNTDKALKVVEMLREYKETKEIKSMLLTKSILESFTNTKIKNFEIHTDGMGDYFKVDIVKKVECFKFPADEDVEV